MSDKDRIVDLQKQVRIARTALNKIVTGNTRNVRHADIAIEALDDMWRVGQKQSLQGLVGHE